MTKTQTAVWKHVYPRVELDVCGRLDHLIVCLKVTRGPSDWQEHRQLLGQALAWSVLASLNGIPREQLYVTAKFLQRTQGHVAGRSLVTELSAWLRNPSTRGVK